MNKTDAISRATKRAFKAAKNSGSPITWQLARRLGVLWCAKMWPDDFADHPWIEWRNGHVVLKAAEPATKAAA